MMGEVQNGRVLPPCGAVVNNSDTFGGFGKWYWNNMQNCKIDPALMHDRRSDVVASIGGRTKNRSVSALVSLVSFATTAFSHVVMDSLPKASAICGVLSLDSVGIVVSTRLQQDLVQLVCPDAESSRFLILTNNCAVTAPMVYIPLAYGLIGMYPPRTLSR